MNTIISYFHDFHAWILDENLSDSIYQDIMELPIASLGMKSYPIRRGISIRKRYMDLESCVDSIVLVCRCPS